MKENKKIKVSSVYGKAVDVNSMYPNQMNPEKKLEMLEHYLSPLKLRNVYAYPFKFEDGREFSIVIFQKKILFLNSEEEENTTTTFEFWGHSNDAIKDNQKMTYLFDKWIDDLDAVEFEIAIREAIDEYMDSEDYVDIENEEE